VMELYCHRGGGLPAVHGESVGKLEGRGLLTWAPVPLPFLSSLVLESPVRSGYWALVALTETETG
jgi:hypothetical protein